MAKINFTCTQCGRILNLPAEYAGRLVKCPHCGHSSAVPFPSTRRTRQQPAVPTQDVDAEVVSTTSASLWPALGYPFRRGGFVIVLILTAGLLLARAFIYLSSFSHSSFRHVAGTYTLDIFAVGYLCLYAITILKSCANGQDDLPYWPDIEEYSGGIYRALFLVTAAVVFSWGPLIAYQAINLTDLAEFTLHPRDPIAHLLAVWALFYFPMNLLAIALFDSAEAVKTLCCMCHRKKTALNKAADSTKDSSLRTRKN